MNSNIKEINGPRPYPVFQGGTELHSVYLAVLNPKQQSTLLSVFLTMEEDERADFGMAVESKYWSGLWKLRNKFIDEGLWGSRLTKEEYDELISIIEVFQKREDPVLDANHHTTIAQILLSFLEGTDEDFLYFLGSDEVRQRFEKGQTVLDTLLVKE